MVKITAEIIREMAALAKLHLTEGELKNLKEDLTDIVKYVEKLDELGNLLESHIRKEERSLFPEIEKILSEEELELLAVKLAK